MLLLHPFTPSPQHWRLLLVLGLMLAGMALAKAQDIHTSIPLSLPTDLPLQFSQQSPNQAQLSGRYRNQWLRVPQGYQTNQLAYAERFQKWSWGLQIHRQKAAPQAWQRLKFSTALAYQQPLSDNGTALLLGLEGGFMQHRLGDEQSYDQQYIDGQGFDPSLSAGEPLGQGPSTHFDWSVGFGLLGDWLDTRLRRWQIVGSVAHLHRPLFTDFGSPVYWEPRWSVGASYSWEVAEALVVQGQAFYQQQQEQQEWQAGGRLGIKMTADARMWLGLAYRAGDALIAQAAWEEEQVSVWLAYDHTTSALAKGTSDVGAFEIGASYRWGQKNKLPKKAKTSRAVSELATPAKTLLDSDGDGVPDELDKCPLIVGLAVFQGCNDKDQDGVIDPEDSCPEVFGSRDRNGCPWTQKDTDLDGVPDDADYCVFIKGLPSLNGCPDTDQDGVSDIDDECPYLKGELQYKGCPAPEPAINPLAPSLQEEEQLAGPTAAQLIVEFDTDQHLIVPTFQALLEDFAAEYAGQTNLRILIAGHTDYEGTAEYNVALGQRRAEAVRIFLRNRLPLGTQFELISYGELLPIDSNYSVDGRARNRRAEVRVLKQ